MLPNSLITGTLVTTTSNKEENIWSTLTEAGTARVINYILTTERGRQNSQMPPMILPTSRRCRKKDSSYRFLVSSQTVTRSCAKSEFLPAVLVAIIDRLVTTKGGSDLFFRDQDSIEFASFYRLTQMSLVLRRSWIRSVIECERERTRYWSTKWLWRRGNVLLLTRRYTWNTWSTKSSKGSAIRGCRTKPCS